MRYDTFREPPARPPFIRGGTPKVENGVCTAALRDDRGAVHYCDRGEGESHLGHDSHGVGPTGHANVYWFNDDSGAGSSS